MVRGFLRHLSTIDGQTEVPVPGLLGPAGHRTPPHVYSDREIADLLHAATGLAPAGGLRPHCYAVLLGLIACTGLRISEALALTCGDVDLAQGVLTVRAGKRGRTRVVPLHPSALDPLRGYARDRARRFGPPRRMRPSVLGWFGPVVGSGHPGVPGVAVIPLPSLARGDWPPRHPGTTRLLIENCELIAA